MKSTCTMQKDGKIYLPVWARKLLGTKKLKIFVKGDVFILKPAKT